jgi:hypothetical protein
MAKGQNRLISSASTGVNLEIWRNDGLFHAAPADGRGQPQVCLGVDLFEVIAELAGLDLEDADHAGEAERLAEHAKHKLGSPDRA